MALRRRIASFFADAVYEQLEARLSLLVDRVVSERPSASETDDLESRLATLTDEQAKLKKKLSMAMGAIQASTTQLMALRAGVERATSVADQAMQAATTARATAESASEGLTALEGQPDD